MLDGVPGLGGPPNSLFVAARAAKLYHARMTRPPIDSDARLLHSGVKFDLYQVEVSTRAGGKKERELIWHGGSVVMLPILDDGQVLLIRNKRHSIGRTLVELPAGTIEADDTSAEAAARRELQEETGYTASTLTELCHFYTTPGFSNHHLIAFLATGLNEGQQKLDAEEDIVVIKATLDQVLSMIVSKEIIDAKTMATVFYYQLIPQHGDSD